MPLKKITACCLGCLFLCRIASFGQSPAPYSRDDSVRTDPAQYLDKAQQKTRQIVEALTGKTVQYLQHMAKEEQRLRRQLQKKDSTAAGKIFDGSQERYQQLQDKIKQPAAQLDKFRNVYNGHLDSMKTALDFLRQNNSLAASSPVLQAKLNDAMGNMEELQGKFNQTEDIRKILTDRQAYLQEQLGKFGMAKDIEPLKETVYYYRAQMDEYKKTFEDPSKIEAKTIEILANNPAFRDYFNQHSGLGSLFSLAGSGNSTAPGGVPIPGLQSRDMLTQDLLQRFGSAPNVQQAVQQGIQTGQSQLSQLKDKVSQSGGGGDGGGDANMPDFKPNAQKTKSFLRRLEYGVNLQSSKSNSFFPVTSDLGVSIGYKINEKSIAGIGASYKIGWGQDIHHMALTNQGIGFRSFLDIKLKGNLWISGGGELNYKSQFSNFQILKDYSPWQKSALLGLTKKYKAGNKLKGNMQLLYDFLYRQQVPMTQPLVFRMGYSF